MKPSRIHNIIDEFDRCADFTYFIQRFLTGKPLAEKTRDLVKRQYQMDRILKKLNSNNKV